MSELEPSAEEAPNFAKAEMTFEQFARRMNGEIARYSAALAASDLERIRLRSGLREALDLADEGWAYASGYYRDKWDFEKRMAELAKLVTQ